MAKRKKLSNSFSTGSGGGHFEAHVQASFVTLMLTGGHVPYLPCWPITEIKLQGKVDGFDTDDLIVFIEDVNSKERRKLLGQVKHSIGITLHNPVFAEVIQAAWNDFNNPDLFNKGRDVIALITGPLSATDQHTVSWLLNTARHTKNSDEFFRYVQQANFSPPKSKVKIEVFQHHLKVANDGVDVSNDELYDFLNCFKLLGYDLGNESGVVLSLLHSHISQFEHQHTLGVWSRVVETVQIWGKDAGTITHSNLPEDLREAFKKKAKMEMPTILKAPPVKSNNNWLQHTDATYLALAVLLGSWNDKNIHDIEAITQLFGIDHEEWLRKAQDLLHCPDSPLSLKNGIWNVVNRTELWKQLGSRIIDQDLDTFKRLAISILKESDPAFELPAKDRYAASIYGKELQYSRVLRKGVAEGLAILASQLGSCNHCSQGKAEVTSVLVIRELLAAADWIRWGSLDGLLPALAEAAPGEYLAAIEAAIRLEPCPFDELFSQEGDGITGGNYLTGLLWSLEGLAWDEQYLVRVCVVLGEIASHDPGGRWANRPSNSLTTILLPWMPQTLASIEKRKVAVDTLLKEVPEIAWELIIQLLPDEHRTSFGTHKPIWRGIIPENWEKGVKPEEYWQQSSYYAERAVAAAGNNIERLTKLIDRFDSLTEPAFEQLVNVLSSEPIYTLSEEKRLPIWNRLNKFTSKHRKFSDTNWALPEELIVRIEKVATLLAPIDPFNLYQKIFSDRETEFYNENGDWEEQAKKLDLQREMAISEIFNKYGMDGVIRFAESVSSPHHVGYSICHVVNNDIERALLPNLLDSDDNKHRMLVSSFIYRKTRINGWEWVDSIDRTSWTPVQIGQFLACLPFSKEAWKRAANWLLNKENEYWSRVHANAYQIDGDPAIAIDKFIEHGRPHAAISCLSAMRHTKQVLNADQCVRALLGALSSEEDSSTMNRHSIIELIKYLQTEPSVEQDHLFRVEWAYLPLLDRHSGLAPKCLERKLATEPEFFSELIRLIYRSKKNDQPVGEVTETSKMIATNAWQLLREWKSPPGTQEDGTFSEERFVEWIRSVKEICTESGHLEVALTTIGEVLIHTPPDINGLWIRRVVADVLNGRDAESMRDGFSSAIYNSRGVHWVDPSGKQERELAEQYRRKAEEVENAGFVRLAVTLREVADGYDRDAERIINRHED
ncbi:hypothetical protein J4G63_15430 [Aeromonas sobria]|uniref:Uncharacterized protein n=1 Tax=Aeromonas sobria TaxID=646 RepID=A0A1S2CXD2_AERSO|nr:hypothetical protein [Aeromonas sobria]MBS4688626.1 hypothetical protein [Aeromonas sobria]OHY92433.1 hypothetical protein BJD16_13175 [Aeromonas sobria]